MDISVIIVGWNTKGYLAQCLESLAVAPPTRATEIIVVDNASTDGSADMVEASFPHIKLIRSDENVGFAKANNLAIQQSRGRYISLVNPDVKVLPGCLDALADYLDQNPSVGNVGPRVLNTDLTLQSSCRQFPNLWNNFCSAVGLATAFPHTRVLSGEHMLSFSHDRIMMVDALVGCFWMIRRPALEAVGPLDEDFFMYGEDVDWCRRCWNAGWKVSFLPNAQAIHHRGTSSAAQPVRAAVVQQRSTLHYWSKHHGLPGVLAVKGIILCHHMIRCLGSVVLRFCGASRAASAAARLETSKACLKALMSGNVSHNGWKVQRRF